MKLFKTNIVLIFLLIFGGCDIFETRDSEDPKNNRSNFIAATTPDILFQNLSSAFREKALDNYMRSFIEEESDGKEFRFFPAPSAIAKFPSLNQWSRENEESYFNNVITATDEGTGITLDLTGILFNVTQGDSAVYQIEYIINIPFSDSDSSTFFQGRAEFNLSINSQNQWVINRWDDSEINNFPTWSELKGQFN